jgi:hypothetical protein
LLICISAHVAKHIAKLSRAAGQPHRRFVFRLGLSDLGGAVGRRVCRCACRACRRFGVPQSHIATAAAYLNRIFTATKNPTRLSFLLIALAVALPAAPLGPDSKLVFVRCLVLATICLIGWTALKALHIGANLYLRNFHTDVPDNLLARKHVTQVRVLVRALDTIIVLLTLGFALMTFDTVRQYGISLFASAPPPRSPRASGPHRRQRSKCEWRRMIFAIQAIHIRSRTIAAGTGSQLCCYRAL